MTRVRRTRTSHAAVLALLTVLACTDSVVDSRDPPAPGGPPGKPVTIQQVLCGGRLSSLSMRCGAPDPGVSSDIIVGGQNVYVTLASSNVAYNSGSGQFTFDVTIQNLIEQPIGTTDGIATDPNGIRIFFETGPTVVEGTGTASVVPDGFATFTAVGQPFYQYNTHLAQNATSAARTWTLLMPASVDSFAFTVYVSAPVQWPDGYVTLNGMLPGSSFGSLHPGDTENLVAVIKSPVGNVLPGSVTFGTTNPLCATVDGGGTVTGVQAATCQITATAGLRTGSLSFDVTGMVRQWDGSESADWSVGANWVNGLAPVAADSVFIPTGVPNDPALVANTSIQGAEVADGATLSLGAFDLTLAGNAATGSTPGSGILGTTGLLRLAGTSRTVHGRLPMTLVSGSYSLSGNVSAAGLQQVDAGELDNPGFELFADAQ